jgi:hypothetical protein
MLDAALDLVLNNLALIGATVLLGTLLIWAVKDAREEDEYRDAAKETASRARRYTGGALGVLGVFIYAVLGTIYQTGMSLAEILDMLVDIVAMDPTMFAGAGVALLGALGLEGVIPVGALGFVVFAAVVFVISALIRRRSNGGAA